MKTITKLKLTFFFACFITFNFSAIAGNTIRMITRCAGWVSHSIVVTNTKQFTVDWGDGSSIESFTGTGNSQSLTHNYLNSGRYEVTFSGTSTDCSFLVFNADRADTLDLSSCPSIQKIIQNPALGTLRSLNTNNCTHLEEIHVSGNLLTVLDLKDNIALKQLICQDNQLTHINLVSNEIELIWCDGNYLPLSYLYTFSEMITDLWKKVLGPQRFATQKIRLGNAVDFSDQIEFGGTKTVFQVAKGLQGSELAPPEEYQMEEGIVTFLKSGYYRVIMLNAAITSHPEWPAMVVVPFEVIDFVPVSEIIDLPEETVAGIQLNLTGTVVPDNATYKTISWSVKDAGNTGATITANKLYTTASGTATVTATIEDGSAIGTNYTQDFTIVVNPVGIAEPAGEMFSVWPNPTTGELKIENVELKIESVEVFDVYGRKLLSHHLITSSSNHLINISHLNPGIYFVKITTDAGEIVKKVVKQ